MLEFTVPCEYLVYHLNQNEILQNMIHIFIGVKRNQIIWGMLKHKIVWKGINTKKSLRLAHFVDFVWR